MDVVSVSGIGYSGSGAVLDLLKEYENCCDVCGDDEFLFLYLPDALDDLAVHLTESCARFHSSDVAINRFIKVIQYIGLDKWDNKTGHKLSQITEEFLSEVVQVKWKGNWIYDALHCRDSMIKYLIYRVKRKANSLLKKYAKRTIEVIPKRQMYFSVNPNDFYSAARRYMERVVASCVKNGNLESLLVLNQAFPANNPSRYLNYFDKAKCIVINRDPRDIFVSLKRVNNTGSSWFPTDNVDDFIIYYRKLCENQGQGDAQILILNFEDLIYKYDETVRKIEEFITESGDHRKRFEYFNPNKSIQNTQLFRYYTQYAEEIAKIEKELATYLYVFPEGEEISHESAF